MRKKSIILALILILLMTTAVGFLLSVKSFLSYNEPQMEDEIQIKGLYEPVEVLIDSFGVPHIYANNDHDLFFTLGWFHAANRLFQMEINIRASLGRLSEIFGKKALDYDKFSRTIGFYRIAETIYKKLDSESKAILNSYVEGINQYIKDSQKNLPLEFRLLSFKPLLWQPEYCIAYLRLIGWQLTQSWSYESSLYSLSQLYSTERIKELTILYGDEWPETLNEPILKKKVTTTLGNFHNIATEFREICGFSDIGVGSNNWVISGSKSRTGYPILCNDPHLAYTQPSIWFEAHLSSPNFNVYGVTFPGLPGIVIGRNRYVAWGFTNMMLDDVDFYIEKLSPDGNYYLHGEEWKRIGVVHDTIVVRKKRIPITIKYTHHGPIINSVNKALGKNAAPISVKWSGADFSNETKAILLTNRAKNFQEFLKGASLFKVPGQNVAYADIEGNIALVPMGGIPIRSEGYNYLLPLKGDDPATDWKGYIPFEDVPFELNPRCGYVASANAKIFDGSFNYYVSNHYEPPYRLMRIRQVLSADSAFSISDMMKLQLDVKSLFARDLLAIFFQVVKPDDIPEKYREYHSILKNWNFDEKIDSPEATLFNVFVLKLIENIYGDEIKLAGKEVYKSFLDYPSFAMRNSYLLLKKGESMWFDDITTKRTTEMRPDILKKSFVCAVKYLIRKRGSDIGKWQWGQVHKLYLQHPLGTSKILNWLFRFDRGPYPVPGSQFTINCGMYKLDRPFKSFVGPSVRFIFPFEDSNVAYSVIPNGQSGVRGSKHYSDQTDMYLKGIYKKVYLDRIRLLNSGVKVLSMQPAG